MLRAWLLVLALFGSGIWVSGIASAQDAPKLAQVCIDAKITTQKDCDALLKKLAKGAHNPADKGKGGNPASTSGPASPPLPKPCLAAGIKTQADCDAFLAAQKKAATTPPPAKPQPNVAAPAANTPPPVVTAPKLPPLPKDCLAAGVTTQADCDAFHAAQAAKQKALAASKPKPAPETTSTTPPANNIPPPPVVSKPVLPKDCVAAGVTTLADCAALYAAQKAKLHAAPNLKSKPPGPAANAPAGPPAVTPSPPTTTTKPLAVTLPQDCLDAGLKTKADCDALHAMQKAHAGPPKTSAGPAAGAPPASAPAVQPTEIVPVLPKGVTKAQIAPLLDSAKLIKRGVAPKPAAPPPPIAPPPPTDDKAAQAAVKPVVAPAIDKQPGTPIAPTAKAATVQLPPNVTIINQTNINQTIVNNITNNNVVQPRPAPPPNPIGLSIGIVVNIGGGQLVVNSSGRDQYRIADQDRDHTSYEQLSHGRYRETILRPDGSRIVTIYDRDGDVLGRSRFDPDGREIILADFDYSADPDLGQWRDPGDDLPPLQLQVPADDYVLDADQADEGQIRLFFAKPPVEPLHRLYSISEVERSARLRDILPRVELGDLTFDTGSADLGPDQIGALSGVAHAMLALLQQNPAETFLIEGHTDAVGSDASNLVLSDERAASVAQILTQAYQIPPENLATQGYGDHFLKIQTDGPERLNRRVVIRRITPLIASASR